MLTDDQKKEMIKKGRDRMLAVQLILNANREQYTSLVEEFDRAYLSGINKYPKTPIEACNPLKGWKKRRIGNKTPGKLGLSFNTMGDDEEKVFVNSNGYKGPKCTRCGRTNHGADACYVTKHVNGTVLHVEGEMLHTMGERRDTYNNGLYQNILAL